MISFKVTGSFNNLEKFLRNATKIDVLGIMDACGREGVAALARATPVETGMAAYSWDYTVSASGGVYTIAWLNGNVENGFQVVLALQYGHGTGTGGYVQGRDFINPAIRPVFDKIADRVWRAVTSA